MRSFLDVRVLAALLGVSGIGHVVRPGLFESIVPAPLPYKRELVYVSGAADLVCSMALFHPRPRR